MGERLHDGFNGISGSRKQTRTSVHQRRHVRCNARLERRHLADVKKQIVKPEAGLPTDILDACFRQTRQSDRQRFEGLSRCAVKTTTHSLRRCCKAGRDRNVKMHRPNSLRWACHESDLWERSTVQSDPPNHATRYANQLRLDRPKPDFALSQTAPVTSTDASNAVATILQV